MQETDLPATNAFKECKFHCTNGNCLHLGSLICNQLNNCGDNSDEENCPVVTQHPPPGIFNSELEFVQIVIIIVVMTVMVVVIICLLNHYKLSTWSFMTRQSQARRHDHALQQDGCLWPSDSGSRQGASEVLFAAQTRDRFTTPSFMHRERFSRFQPTYPYLQHQIDLPPTISLSDGEEPPPYQGPCTLQLRDPEQQMELNRESVRAPPNRTIYDSDLIDMGGGGTLGGVGGGGGGGPRPPSSNSGISATNSSSHGRMEGPPPAYSEVMGHYPGSAFFLHQHNNNQRVCGPGSRTIQQQSQSESTIVPAKAKDGQPEDMV
ncbi:low-density lipoprotein receptor class A domain-containing protein 4-like isoform X1 [Betta splendens]|uniref:Low-density lipoprotein receptor class A domain-containing protein 4-like isoform X1 n=1 Tax=Betta splendens TaxID=158456 RepID=A0A6P7KRE5_BETSP|nr:low-density lipoprotein receptor class A domain-containing protein 4-like isoform X1 [Betta splendens]XP_028985031.1 low-density lipoprotein receptor class A domain-containing protein 4-like isoform X1 [Betta splendens]XP_040923723.1 low-density lipoprotein receptor class A domain-containing protein 4-like isoform X1 [Betta splendens]